MDQLAAPGAPSLLLPGVYTVSTLPAPSASNLGYYAAVSDLFGEKRDVVLCSQVGGNYFWQPVRPVYAKSTSADQNLNLQALVSPSILIFTGALSVSRTYTLSLTNAFPGAVFQLIFTGTLGVNTLTIAGLDAGGTILMAVGANKTIVFDSTTNTWKALP